LRRVILPYSQKTGRCSSISDPQANRRNIQPERKFTANPEAAEAERRDLLGSLERGFQRIQESEEFRRYLDTVSRFHSYSVANTMLIWMQRPDATLVAGFRTWLSLGRHVQKGEKGIRIFAPIQYPRTKQTSGEPTDNSEDHETRPIRFRSISVFDISQTKGEDLAQAPVSLLSGDDLGLWKRLANIAHGENLTIDRKPGRGGPGQANGWYDRARREVWVDPSLEPRMAAKTLCHEIGHHYAEHIDRRAEHETIAESVAYIVLGHFAIDAGDYSFGYLASWTDVATFKAKLGDIQAIAGRIIEQIEETEPE
jgi:hypothetical protein